MDNYVRELISNIINLVGELSGYLQREDEDFEKEKSGLELKNKSSNKTVYIDFKNYNLNKSKQYIENLKKTEISNFKVDLKKEVKQLPPRYSDGNLRKKRRGYEYRFTFLDDTGKKIRKSVCGKTEQECYDKRTSLISGKIKPKKQQESILLYGDWLKTWYQTYKTRKDGSKINPQNELYINTHITPKLGSIPLKNLTGIDIQNFLKDFDDRTNTRNKLSKLINASLNMALANRLIEYNPFVAVSVERHQSKSYNVIQPKEQNLLLQEIKNPKYNALFWLCCCTGMRINEAISSLPHIDYKNCIINVVNEDTATKKHKRQIPFLPDLINEERKKLLSEITATGTQLYFYKLFSRLNMDFVVHSFRHTFISCCYHVGIKDKQIQKWAGHSSIKMTMDTYTTLLDNESSPIIDYLMRLKQHLGI